MVRRKKIVPVGASTSGVSGKPTIRVLELDETSLSAANVKFHFARTYTPKLLAEHFRNGFSGSLVVRTDEAPHGIDNACKTSLYLSYALGLIDGYSDLLIVDNDADGALTAALLHHGAALLYDDRLVASTDGICRPIGDKTDTSIKPLLDTSCLEREPGITDPTKLVYTGEIPDDIFELISYSAFASNLEAEEPVMADTINQVYATAGIQLNVEGYKTQFLYAASFGFFDETEIEICLKTHALTYADRSLALALFDTITGPRLNRDPRTPQLAVKLQRIRDVCRIWIHGLGEALQRGDARDIARDAVAMMDGSDPLISSALAHWRTSGADTDKSSEIIEQVVAVGLACGIDSMVEAYMSGTPLEYIIEEG